MSEQHISNSLKSLLKAQSRFELFRKKLVTDQDKAGAIQAFEFCYELAWKTMRKALALRGIEVNSPRETFREASREHFIPNPEPWFEFLKKRNLTVHTYDEENAEEIIRSFDSFSIELAQLIRNLESTFPCK